MKPRYACFVKALEIDKNFDGNKKPFYSFIVYLIIDPETPAQIRTSTLFKKEIGKIKTLEKVPTTTLITHIALRKALMKLIGMNMTKEKIDFYVDDAKIGKHLCKQPNGGRKQRVSKLYDFHKEAKKNMEKIIPLFTNIEFHHIPEMSNSRAIFMLENRKNLP